MDTETMIRELNAVAEKHKNDFVPTFQTNITAMCRDIIPKLEQLKEYEEIGTPNEIRAKLCFLTTYKRAESDGRLVLILDKDGYCEELGGLHIDEIKKRCLESEG